MLRFSCRRLLLYPPPCGHHPPPSFEMLPVISPNAGCFDFLVGGFSFILRLAGIIPHHPSKCSQLSYLTRDASIFLSAASPLSSALRASSPTILRNAPSYHT